MNMPDDFGYKAGYCSTDQRNSTTGIVPLKSTQCRLFPADVRQASDLAMQSLGDCMQSPEGVPCQASKLPTGYSFLSQFIAHDVVPTDEQGELPGFGCRTLDLDCVYGDAQSWTLCQVYPGLIEPLHNPPLMFYSRLINLFAR